MSHYPHESTIQTAPTADEDEPMEITVRVTDIRPPFTTTPAQNEVEVALHKDFFTLDARTGALKANASALISQLQDSAAVIKGWSRCFI